MAGTYWDNDGTYEALATALHRFIPAEGVVEDQNRPKLEIYRRACNSYYDAYNNGGCNRKIDISGLFGVAVVWDEDRGDHILDFAFPIIEAAMDRIILDAAREAGLIAGE